MTDELKIKRKVREINDHLFAGKPVYWDKSSQKRLRVFRARLSKGKFQIMPMAGQKWIEAGIEDHFEFHR